MRNKCGEWVRSLRTNVGSNPSHDDLFLACRLNCGAEFGVVPGVDFAMALD